MTADRSDNLSREEADGSATPASGSSSGNRGTRRRVIKTGLVAMPAILTLSNRVALGNGEGPIAKPSGGWESNFYVSSGGDEPDPVAPGSLDGISDDESSGGLDAAGYGGSFGGSE